MRNFKICKITAFLGLGFLGLPTVSAQQSVKMPHVVVPYTNSSRQMQLYQPGITHITDVSGIENASNLAHEGFSGSDQKSFTVDSSVSSKNSSEVSVQQESKTVPSSADFLKLNILGKLSKVKELIGAQRPSLSSIISEFAKAKSNFKDNSVSTSNSTDLTQQKVRENLLLAQASDDVSILRFIIDGQDIQSSCENLYFSGIEDNGAFILTGDFSYLAGEKSYKDTFYFLFTTKGTEDGEILYKLTSVVEQNVRNPQSPVLKLANIDNLTAHKTGAFVSVHDSRDDIKIDFLLSFENLTMLEN